MATRNQYGVLVGCEEVLLAEGIRFRIVALIGEYRGQWYYGLDLRSGGIAVGAFGLTFLPDPDRSTAFPTRQAALDAAREKAIAEFRRKLDVVPWGQPADQAHRKALEALLRERQGALF